MTTSARTARRGRRNPAQVVVAALILLGVLASALLVFSDTVEMLRVGIVVALWAAVIGAMAMTKYRRESVVDRAKTRDLQTVYELQLEREISARREFEAGVETRVRREVGAEAAELAALRAELAALRAGLERLFDGELPVERVAVRADTRREIDGHTLDRQGIDGVARIAVDRRTPTPVLGNGASAAQLAGPNDSPVTVPAVEVPPTTVAAAPEVLEAESVAAATGEEATPAPADLPDPEPGSRRSRRRNGNGANPDGEHTVGLSVAEIMANLRAESVAAEPAEDN